MNVSLCSLNEMITNLGYYKKRFEIEAEVNFIMANWNAFKILSLS